MLKVLSRKEWIISHTFLILGLIFISQGTYLHYNPGTTPAWIPLIGGVWLLFGGFCFVAAYLARRLKSN